MSYSHSLISGDELYNVRKIPDCLKDHTYYNAFDSVGQISEACTKPNEIPSIKRKTDGNTWL